MDMLHSQGHQIYGLRVNEVSLSPLDTKRWIVADGISTLANGHREAGCRKLDAYIEELLSD